MNDLKTAVDGTALAPTRTALFGGISLGLFGAGAVGAFVIAQASSDLSGEEGIGKAVGAVFLCLGGSVLATISGVVSLWPGEPALARGDGARPKRDPGGVSYSVPHDFCVRHCGSTPPLKGFCAGARRCH